MRLDFFFVGSLLGRCLPGSCDHWSVRACEFCCFTSSGEWSTYEYVYNNRQAVGHMGRLSYINLHNTYLLYVWNRIGRVHLHITCTQPAVSISARETPVRRCQTDTDICAYYLRRYLQDVWRSEWDSPLHVFILFMQIEYYWDSLTVSLSVSQPGACLPKRESLLGMTDYHRVHLR